MEIFIGNLLKVHILCSLLTILAYFKLTQIYYYSYNEQVPNIGTVLATTSLVPLLHKAMSRHGCSVQHPSQTSNPATKDMLEQPGEQYRTCLETTI